jgi:hypothetical protein
MVKTRFLLSCSILVILGACASRMKDQMKEYREAFKSADFEKASGILEKSVLK